MCIACQRGGPHLSLVQVRWRVRGENVPRSALSQADVEKLIGSGVITEETLIAREGGGWHPFIEHPDFRGRYLPGSVEDVARRATLAEASAEERRAARGQRLRVGLATLAAAASVGLAVYATANGLFVISPETTDQISSRVNQTIEQVTEPVDAAGEALAPLPLLETLPAPKSIKDGLPMLLYRGQRGLLSGTETGLADAREAMERAVSIAPLDPEALAGLAEVYARLLPSNPSLLNPMTSLLSRAQRLAEGSPAARRALAASELAEGRSAAAAEHVLPCGSPAAEVGNGKVDLGCALLLAEARQDFAALDALAEAYPDISGLDLARARVALAQEDWVKAAALGAALSERYPDEPTGWSTLLIAASTVGDWRKARSAGEALMGLEVSNLAALQRYAQVMLRVYDQPEVAAQVLARLMAHPSFKNYVGATQVLLDAAEADMARRSWGTARGWAQQAVDQGGPPSARMMLAWAELQDGDESAALETMSKLTISTPISSAEASLHLGAARLYMALGDQRGAGSELELALLADPSLLAAHLDAAVSKLRTGDVLGTMETLQDAAFSEWILPRRQTRLDASWMPPADVGSLRRDLEVKLREDARLMEREPEIRAILAWVTREGGARSRLEASAQAGSSVASAALAQLYVEEGRCKQALPLLERALNSRPGAVTLMAMRGYCLASARDAQAERALEQARAKDPGSLSALYWSALGLEVLEKDEAARAAWRDYLVASPGDVLGREALVRLQGG